MAAPTKYDLLGPKQPGQPTPTISRAASPAPTSSSLPTHDASGNILPAILMLHGGGSNATVFKIQSRRLLWNLSGTFRFVFAQAPIEGTPGFGMLPVFESCKPFYRWVERRFVIGEGEVEETPEWEVGWLDEYFERLMDQHGGAKTFVGVMGFSQGARLVPGLLLRQKLEERDKLGGSLWKLRFGVMVGGPYPPICVHKNVKVEDYELLKGVPSVHAWGKDDHVRSGCEILRTVCGGEEGKCFSMEFDGGHHLPLTDRGAAELCGLIRRAWEVSGDGSGRGGENVAR